MPTPKGKLEDRLNTPADIKHIEDVYNRVVALPEACIAQLRETYDLGEAWWGGLTAAVLGRLEADVESLEGWDDGATVEADALKAVVAGLGAEVVASGPRKYALDVLMSAGYESGDIEEILDEYDPWTMEDVVELATEIEVDITVFPWGSPEPEESDGPEESDESDEPLATVLPLRPEGLSPLEEAQAILEEVTEQLATVTSLLDRIKP